MLLTLPISHPSLQSYPTQIHHYHQYLIILKMRKPLKHLLILVHQTFNFQPNHHHQNHTNHLHHVEPQTSPINTNVNFFMVQKILLFKLCSLMRLRKELQSQKLSAPYLHLKSINIWRNYLTLDVVMYSQLLLSISMISTLVYLTGQMVSD